jgi:hypothetical protein
LFSGMKKSPGAENADGVVEQRKRRYQKYNIGCRRKQSLTSFGIGID